MMDVFDGQRKDVPIKLALNVSVSEVKEDELTSV